jgi:anti-sigma factor RsiW
VNCSACKARIGALRDGELPARDARLVESHLESCAACRAFAERLDAIEASLVRLAPIEPRQDFTIAVMAGIAALPVPERQPARLWWLVIADVALWIAIGALTAFGAIRWKALVAGTAAFAAKFGVAATTIYSVAIDFHAVPIVALGIGVEIASLALIIAFGRKHLSRVRATLSGVLS